LTSFAGPTADPAASRGVGEGPVSGLSGTTSSGPSLPGVVGRWIGCRCDGSRPLGRAAKLAARWKLLCPPALPGTDGVGGATLVERLRLFGMWV
jgi:hypothetical protein